MKENKETLNNDYFDKVYKENPDPWNFEKSEYEREKYTRTLLSLPKDIYNNALEIGCSIGILTKRLADRCEHLISIDLNEVAINNAKERLKDKPNVKLEVGSIPNNLPLGKCDLVVMSEVGYYLNMEDLRKAKSEIKMRMEDNADLILVHWTHDVADYPLSGDQVNECFLADEDFTVVTRYRSPDYRLEVLKLK